MIRGKKIISLLLIAVLCFGMMSIVQADDIEDKKREKAAAEAEHAGMSSELTAIIEDTKKTEEDISAKQAEIREATEELDTAKVEEHDQYVKMKKRIKYMFENGDVNFLEIICQATDITDFLNKIDYVQQITDTDRRILVEFQDLIEEIKEKEEALQADNERLVELQNNLISKQGELQAMLDSKSSEIAGLEGEISRLIAEAEEAARIQREAEEAARLAAERQQAANSGGTPSRNPGASSNVGNGRFAHPCPAGRISSHFGPRWGTMHLGTDFAAPIGTPTYAAEAGTVIISQFSSSAGNYVVINHGNGLVTKYMHHSVNYVGVGQTVTRGQNIGAVGSTGQSTGPHLHFQVEVNGVAENPMGWL